MCIWLDEHWFGLVGVAYFDFDYVCSLCVEFSALSCSVLLIGCLVPCTLFGVCLNLGLGLMIVAECC